MSFIPRVLLITCDPQSLDAMHPDLEGKIVIDLAPVEGVEYDAFFCYERLDYPIKLKVRENCSYFIPGEPESIKLFGSPFIKQFNKLISFRTDLNQIYKVKSPHPCYTLWRVGLNENLEREGKPRTIRSTKEILEKPIKKTKFMSMIVSDKTGTPLQRARLKLAKILAEGFPGLVDLYGRGHNQIDDKAVALDDYMFSIAIENSSLPNYLTEKLTDCFVTDTVPLYHGCTNYDQFYGSRGIIPIDPMDTESTIASIIKLAQEHRAVYDLSLPSILHYKHKLLTKWNIISMIDDTVRRDYPYPYVEKNFESDKINYFW